MKQEGVLVTNYCEAHTDFIVEFPQTDRSLMTIRCPAVFPHKLSAWWAAPDNTTEGPKGIGIRCDVTWTKVKTVKCFNRNLDKLNQLQIRHWIQAYIDKDKYWENSMKTVGPENNFIIY